MDLASEDLKKIQDAIGKIGLDKEELKTGNFSVEMDYEHYQDKSGKHLRRFIGYVIQHSFTLTLPMDTTRLAEVLSVISKAEVHPEMRIRFTLANPSKVVDELIQRACEDATAKAHLLTKASGVTLGQLVRIEYDWSEISFYSETDYASEGFLEHRKIMAMEITPEFINKTDTVRFVWEISG